MDKRKKIIGFEEVEVMAYLEKDDGEVETYSGQEEGLWEEQD